MWIQSLSARGFEVCARETGTGTNGTGIINWLAFQDQPQMAQGSVAFKGIWTTKTKCNKVMFKQVRPLELTSFAKIFRQQFLGGFIRCYSVTLLIQRCYYNHFWTDFQSFGGRPSVFISAKYTRGTKPEDAMYAWLENVDSKSFEVCIREFLPFDGKHQDTIVVGKYIQIFYFSSFEL